MEVLPERVVTSAYVGLVGGVVEDSAEFGFVAFLGEPTSFKSLGGQPRRGGCAT